MKRPVRTMILILGLLAVAYFLARFFNENSEPTRLQFMIWRTKELSKGILLAITFLLGAFMTAFFGFSGIIAKSMEASRLRRENAALQRLLENQKHSSISEEVNARV